MKRGVGGAVQSFSAYMAQPGDVLAYEQHGGVQRVLVASVRQTLAGVALVGDDGRVHRLRKAERVYLMPAVG